VHKLKVLKVASLNSLMGIALAKIIRLIASDAAGSA
jgi:hypothetical protein